MYRTQLNKTLLENWIQLDANNQSPSSSQELVLTGRGRIFKSGNYSEFQIWKKKNDPALQDSRPTSTYGNQQQIRQVEKVLERMGLDVQYKLLKMWL